MKTLSDLLISTTLGGTLGAVASTIYSVYFTLSIIVITALLIPTKSTNMLGHISEMALNAIMALVSVALPIILVVVVVGILPATVIGAFTGLAIGSFLKTFGAKLSAKKAALAGLLICVVFTTATLIILWLTRKAGLINSDDSPLNFLFTLFVAWIGTPLLIYLGCGGVLGWALHKSLTSY